MTTPVQTAGPVDTNGSFRARAYAGVGAITGIVGFLQTLHILTAEQAASVVTVGSNALALISSVGLLFAAFKTHTQTKNGTFDAPPPPPQLPPPPPALTAAEGVKAVGDAFTEFSNTVAQGLQTVQGVAATLPVLSAVVQPGGAVDEFLKTGKQH